MFASFFAHQDQQQRHVRTVSDRSNVVLGKTSKALRPLEGLFVGEMEPQWFWKSFGVWVCNVHALGEVKR